MTGFTLGDSSGATLGNPTGGTLGTAPTAYQLAGQPIPALVDEVSTHRTLTLSLRVTTEVLQDRVRPAKTDEDQISITTTDTGGFTAWDRAGGSNTFTLTPPQDRQPLRQPGTFYVRRYEEDMVSSSVDEWNVEIEFVRDANRTDRPYLDIQEQPPDTSDSGTGFTLGNDSGATLGNATGGQLGTYNGDRRPRDKWGIETRYGTIIPFSVDAEFIGTGAKGVPRFELQMRLTFKQTHLFEAALARLDGVRIRDIADGPNLPVDDTGGANTLTIESPTPDTVASGDYIAMGWESRRLNDEFAEVALTMAQKR
jgi:hypothetical protein